MSDQDDMREIEDAVDTMILHQRKESREGRGIDLGNRDRLLALIRAKLPAADAEHEAKVEAWRNGAVRQKGYKYGVLYTITQEELLDALNLMRARPAAAERDTAAKEIDRYGPAPTMEAMAPSPGWLARHEAAGELLRAAKEFVADDEWCEDGAALIYFDNLKEAIEAAERAGVKP